MVDIELLAVYCYAFDAQPISYAQLLSHKASRRPDNYSCDCSSNEKLCRLPDAAQRKI